MTAGAAQGTLSLPGQPASLSARVHPLVLYAVCDAFIRRNEGQQRVVGALLGRRAAASATGRRVAASPSG